MGLSSVLRPGGGEANHLLRHGPHSAGGKPGIFFQPIDRHFPGLSDRYRRCYGSAYEVASPRGRALMSLMEEFCREQGFAWIYRKTFIFLREFPNKLEERQMKLW